ncbi:hypothetical protein [Nocardioides sp. W7]|uniref:hypothetical protein n=1 Tax=Nocardioides sp. W7 TaxID=2931390 RepID=UPI001FCFFABA|nr:hypothetical protein [Nocardioides sp. W7]
MRDRERRLKPHHYWTPTLTVTTSAPSEVAVAALVDAFVAARFQVQERTPGRARLRAGSWLREQVADSVDIHWIPRFATWGFRATVDLETLDTAPPTQVRVRMHRVSEHRFAVPHTLRAVETAVQALRAADHHAEAGEVGAGP